MSRHGTRSKELQISGRFFATSFTDGILNQFFETAGCLQTIHVLRRFWPVGAIEPVKISANRFNFQPN
jgi:hypothetical protein